MDIKFTLYFIVPVIAGALILLTGVVFLVINARKKKDPTLVETDEWETTGGKIVVSRMEQHEQAKPGSSGAQAGLKFEPVIEYVYNVKGAEYHSNKIFPGDSIFFSEKEAQEILDEHPLYMYVPVLYNPEDPSASSLAQRPEAANRIYLAGLVLTSFGMLVCCFSTFMTVVLAIGKY